MAAWYAFNEEDFNAYRHLLHYTLTPSEVLPKQRDTSSCGVFSVLVGNTCTYSEPVQQLLFFLYYFSNEMFSLKFGADWVQSKLLAYTEYSADDILHQREAWKMLIQANQVDMSALCCQCGKKVRSAQKISCSSHGCSRVFCRNHVSEEWRDAPSFLCKKHRPRHR